MSTNAVLVKKIDGLQVRDKIEVIPRIRLAVLPSEKAHKIALTKQKRPVLTHTDHGKHQKANGTRSLKNVPRLCISTSLKARFDKRMQTHSMPHYVADGVGFLVK